MAALLITVALPVTAAAAAPVGDGGGSPCAVCDVSVPVVVLSVLVAVLVLAVVRVVTRPSARARREVREIARLGATLAPGQSRRTA